MRKFDKVEDAIDEISKGRIVIVADDEGRENEGDFVCAAETVTPEIVSFMINHGRGLVCAPITQQRARQLQLKPMLERNTEATGCSFLMSVDADPSFGVTTGISAQDRAITIRRMLDDEAIPADFRRPGHVFPLQARNNGVLERTGHTETAVDLSRLAGLQPAGVICEIILEDGKMARRDELFRIAGNTGCCLSPSSSWWITYGTSVDPSRRASLSTKTSRSRRRRGAVMHRILYFLVQHSLFPLTRLLFFGNRSGIENLPRAGAYIVAANHSSYIDHFLLAALIQKYRKRKIYFLTRAEAFEGYWSRTWHVATNCVPVDRERPEVGAFRTMAALLKAGEIVVIYPEGTRSESGALLPPKPGAIKLAIHCDVPIVPIGLIGANRILPKRKIVPRWHRAQLHIGAPLRPQDTLRNGKSKEEVALAARDLMGAIAHLCRSPSATAIPTQGAHTVGEGTT